MAMIAEVRSLAVVLVVMLFSRMGFDAMPRQVPFLPVFDRLGTPEQWVYGLSILYGTGALLVLSGRFLQLGCAMAGSAIVLRVLGNMPLYSNGRLLDGLLLLLLALYTPGRGRLFLRVQFLLVYAGAAFNKALDPDWWNGRFVAATLDFHVPPDLAEALAPFHTAAGIGSIVTEAAILVLLAVPRLRAYGVGLLFVFHTTLLVLLREDFGTFYYTLSLAGPLLFLEWPKPREIALPTAELAWLVRLSVFQVFRDAPLVEGPPRIAFAHSELSGAPALLFPAITCLPVLAIVYGILPHARLLSDFIVAGFVLVCLFLGIAVRGAATRVS
jgi:hypothetical protein